MNSNLFFGALIVLLIFGVGYFFYTGGNIPAWATPTPTSTVVTTDSGTATAKADAPTVSTDSKVDTSNSTARVNGHVTPSGAPTTYWYEYGESTTLGTRTASQDIGSGSASIATPGVITGLKANTLYYFRLSAKNQYGTVYGSTLTFNTNSTPPAQGAAPTTSTNSATSVSRTTANLNGRVDPNGSPTTYWFEYGVSAELGKITAFQSAGSATAAIDASVSLSGLNPVTKYYFRLNAQNQYGTVNGSIQSFTTQGPAAGAAPTVDTTAASKVASSSALFNGRINPNGAETTYWFEYSQDATLGSILGIATPQQSVQSGAATVSVSAQANNLSHNTTYYYRLVGRNQAGTTRGDIVSFKTKQ